MLTFRPAITLLLCGLATAAAAVEKDLRTIPGLGSITSSASLIRSEIAVRPDFALTDGNAAAVAPSS